MPSNNCNFEGCKIIPQFNIEGLKKGLFCFTHKLEGMIDVKHKSCEYKGCKTRPAYNIEGNSKAIFCSKHKLEGMVNILSKQCEQEGCKTIPIFNIEGSNKAKFCFTHKLEGMIDIRHTLCQNKDCKTRPTFNIIGSKKAAFCASHKIEGMVDIYNKTCQHEGCLIQPHFNFEGQLKAMFCSKHKLEGMIDIYNTNCEFEGCLIQPHFNFEGNTKSIFCSAHKFEGMIDVKHSTCKTHLCFTRVKEKYDGYCLRCFIHLFPDKPVTKNYKTKEYAVIEFIKKTYSGLSWTTDKKIIDGCSKKRPDLLLDLGYQVIIIEIDEHQHKDYDNSCENKRIMELSQDLGHRPVIFIRFNPDKYINNNNEIITSCWELNKKGICNIKKTTKDEWIKRLEVLKTQIDYWVDPVNKTDKTIETNHLFYDDFN